MDIFTLFKMMNMASTEPAPDLDWGVDWGFSLSGATLVADGWYSYNSEINLYWRPRWENGEIVGHDALAKGGSTYYLGTLNDNTVSHIYTHLGHDIAGTKAWSVTDDVPVQLTISIYHHEPE